MWKLWRVAIIAATSPLGLCGGSFATLDIHAGSFTAGFWGRYVVSDKTTVRPGWINLQNGAASYRIAGVIASKASHVRGIVYAAGCALQTFDVAIQLPRNYEYSFHCEILPQTEIHGSVTAIGKRYDHDVRVEAKYVADWAPFFFGYDDGTATEIPLGGVAAIDEQGQFRLPIPDFSKDRLAGAANRPGEIRVWVRDQVTGQIVDQLRPVAREAKAPAAKLGGIPIELLNPGSNAFSFCLASSPFAHDQFGFSIRQGSGDACAP